MPTLVPDQPDHQNPEGGYDPPAAALAALTDPRVMEEARRVQEFHALLRAAMSWQLVPLQRFIRECLGRHYAPMQGHPKSHTRAPHEQKNHLESYRRQQALVEEAGWVDYRSQLAQLGEEEAALQARVMQKGPCPRMEALFLALAPENPWWDQTATVSAAINSIGWSLGRRHEPGQHSVFRGHVGQFGAADEDEDEKAEPAEERFSDEAPSFVDEGAEADIHQRFLTCFIEALPADVAAVAKRHFSDGLPWAQAVAAVGLPQTELDRVKKAWSRACQPVLEEFGGSYRAWTRSDPDHVWTWTPRKPWTRAS